MEVGIDSFAAAMFNNTEDNARNATLMAQLLERIEHADLVGLDVFGIGEHHRKEFLDSAPAVILAAAAARTRQIHLTSAVAVISEADPVRVFQNFATLDLISNGNDLRSVSLSGKPCYCRVIEPRTVLAEGNYYLYCRKSVIATN